MSDAAETLAVQPGETYSDAICRVLAKFPAGLTGAEMATLLKLSPNAVRPRLSELRRSRAVVEWGTRREKGRAVSVWRLAPRRER